MICACVDGWMWNSLVTCFPICSCVAVLLFQYDPYFDSENPVYISPIWLRFAQRRDEDEYMARTRQTVGHASRILYLLATALMLVAAWFEVGLDQHDRARDVSAAQAAAVFFGFRYSFIVLC